MRKQTILKSTLCLLFTLVCHVAWADTDELNHSTSVTQPEHVYVIKNGNNEWMYSTTAPTQTNPGRFAFYSVDGKENTYQIYSLDLQKWVSYDNANSDTNMQKFVTLAETKNTANSWCITSAAIGNGMKCYQLAPYAANGDVASKYMNWKGGVDSWGANPYEGEGWTVGLWEDNAKLDNGSGWILTEIVQPDAGIPYYLQDLCGTYLDIHNLGKETNDQSCNQLATMNNEEQALFVTAGAYNKWKIHTTAEGGSYLCQKTGGRQWNSWVSKDGANFEWQVDLTIVDGDLYYMLKNISGINDGYIGDDIDNSEDKKHYDKDPLYVGKGADIALKLTIREAPGNILTLSNLDANNIIYPYTLSNDDAAIVFGRENLTIAIEMTTAAELNGRGAVICAADPAAAVPTSGVKANSTYVAYGHYDSWPAYFPSSKDGDRFKFDDNNGNKYSEKYKFSASTTYKVVYVIDKTNQKISLYIDGTLWAETGFPKSDGYTLQSFSNFDIAKGHKLYIGGGVTNASSNYDMFDGTIHSIQFYNTVLTADEIARIEYPQKAERPSPELLEKAEAAHSALDIYGLQRYLGLVQDASLYECNYPSDPADGQGYPGLLDGNYTTYFHSGYSGRNPSPSGVAHYLQADLGKAMKSFRFYTRKRNDNNRPTKITIEGSNDKTSWTEVKVIDGIPTNTPDYYSEEIASATAYQYYRFTVNTTAGGTGNTVFFTFSEFYILPGDYTKVAETFDAVRAYRAEATMETATALNAVYAWNKGLTEGSPIVGVESYIYVDTYKDGAFLNRYLHNNNGTLTPTTELQRGVAAFIWTPAVKEDGKYNFKNKADKYLGHKGMSNSEHNFTVAATTHHMGVTLHTQGSNYFVVKNADGGFDQSSTTYDQKTTNYCTDFVFIPTDLYDQNFEPVAIKSAEEFENGGIYTFVTKRGWMGATASSNEVISTARTAVDPAASATNTMFQWTVYKSAKGNYYLYNIGKGKYMGVQSANNASVPFADAPNNKNLTFKKSSSDEYPIMFSTDNAGVVNHSTDRGNGLLNWADGWDKLNDEGSNHKVTLVGMLTTAELKSISDLVDESEADQVQLYVKAEVEGLEESNPNTHFGTLRVTSKFGGNSIKLKRSTGVATIEYLETPTTVIDFTRAYRGFEFLGFFVGEENLGTNFTPDETLKTRVSEQAPLIAKFRATEDVTLFYDDDPFSYRIPAIGKTSTGRLIAVSDYRHNLDDIGRDVHGTGKLRLDLVMRYSDDNGKTWSAKQTIAEGTGNKNADGYDCAYGDAAIATVGQNVLVMAAAGNVCYPYATAEKNNRTVRVFSADNGVTWTKEDITEKMFIGANALIPNGHAAFFGSGKLAVDANFNGTGKARIYGAMLVKNASATTNIYPIYTDDLGRNWKILGGSTTPVANADEPKIEILPNGQILLSARRNGGRKFNVFTYGTGANDKANGAGTWNGAQDGCGNTGSNGTNGEIYCIDAVKPNGDAVKLLLQSQPKGGSGQYDRKDVSIWYREVSADATYTTADIKDGWTLGLQVSTQQSAYSAMALQDDGKIAFFFEEAPCYGDDYTKGYCMVYVPLSLEEITNNAYSLVLELDENAAVAPQIYKEFKQVVVNRTIKAGNWNTFVVPFDMEIPEGWQVKQLVSSSRNSDNISLVFGDAKSIEAGVPYMVRTTKAVNNIVVKDVRVNTELKNASTGDVDFVGTYANGFVPAGAFFISSNTFYQAADETNTMKAFRAYLQPKVANARSLTYRTDGETTAIDNSPLTNDNGTTVVAIYNLQGVRLDDMHEGVNILQMSDGSTIKVMIK